MIILVISDTHGDIRRAVQVANSFKYDLILHLGDFYDDAKAIEKLTGIKTIGVAGNCDFMNKHLEEDLEIEGVKIKMLHGHKHHVKETNYYLKEFINCEGFDIVLYGHTHVLDETYIGNSLILNHGSISLPRDGLPSYAIVEIGKNKKFFVKSTRLSF